MGDLFDLITGVGWGIEAAMGGWWLAGWLVIELVGNGNGGRDSFSHCQRKSPYWILIYQQRAAAHQQKNEELRRWGGGGGFNNLP